MLPPNLLEVFLSYNINPINFYQLFKICKMDVTEQDQYKRHMKGMDCFAFANTSPTFAAKLKPSPKPDAKKEKIFTMLDLHSNKNEASC